MADMTPDDFAARRNKVFSGLTGRKATAPKDATVKEMLQNLYGTVRGGAESIDTKEAARRQGVSQRTIQRWLKGDTKPRTENRKKLATKNRQSVTTKRGRERTLRRAAAHQKALTGSKPVRVRVHGYQGIATSEHGMRERNSQVKLTAEEYSTLMNIAATDGEDAALSYLQALYSDGRYPADWEFRTIDDFRIDEHPQGDDPRAL